MIQKSILKALPGVTAYSVLTKSWDRVVGVAKTSSGSQVELVGPGHATVVNTAISSMKDSNTLSASLRIV